MIDDKCCGTCKCHRHEDIGDGWVCVNDQSEIMQTGQDTVIVAKNGKEENNEI